MALDASNSACITRIFLRVDSATPVIRSPWHLLVRFRLLVHLHLDNHLEARGPPEQVRHAAGQVVGSLDRPHLERADKKKNLRFELGMLVDLGLIDQLLIDLNDLVSSIGQ
jgi:hypothetical protein